MSLKHFLRLTLLLSLSTLGVNSAAFDDGTWTYKRSGYEATVTGCVAICPPDLVIPSKIDGYSVISIGESAFLKNNLAIVTIPDSVTSISNTGAVISLIGHAIAICPC